ncbi:hypothetical protein [Streptomyces sp. NPDC004286]|uniref:hypothetical protein n=1 Tax=Streptomyces sp. NPDC004286 TaxID=3364696 RepID=UPI003678C317
MHAQATEPVPGLHIYYQPDNARQLANDDTYPWRLGHHSGQWLAGFLSKPDALRAAREIATFADWTRSAQDLWSEPDFDWKGYCGRLAAHASCLIRDLGGEEKKCVPLDLGGIPTMRRKSHDDADLPSAEPITPEQIHEWCKRAASRQFDAAHGNPAPRDFTTSDLATIQADTERLVLEHGEELVAFLRANPRTGKELSGEYDDRVFTLLAKASRSDAR